MSIISDSIFKLAFEAASEGFLVVDAKGTIVRVNSRMESMFGYPNGELLGKTMEILIPNNKKKKHTQLREEYSRNPHTRMMGGSDSKLVGVTKEGIEIPVEISLNSFVMGGDRYVLAVVTDITLRRKVEHELETTKNNLLKLTKELEQQVTQRTAELEKSQRIYEIISQNFPNGVIIVLDENFNCLFAEGKELSKLGIGSHELIGTNYLNRLTGDTYDLVKSTLHKVIEGTNSVCTIEVNNNHYELNIVGIHGSSNIAERILIVESNVTKQKNLEIKQANALAKEKELGIMKSRFVSMASHEFRTPLSAINSSASLIEKYTDTAQQEKRVKHVKRIKASVGNLTGILNDFLSFDKLSSNAIQSHFSNVDLNEIITDVIEELKATSKKNQTITFDEKDAKAHLLNTDSKIIKNIFLNLLSNGLKYTNEDGEVKIKIAWTEKYITISIIDNGIGIPEEEQENLFQRFFRAGNVANIQGTGLGLNIVKKYIEILKGEINFSSKLNEGTTFVVKLPR